MSETISAYEVISAILKTKETCSIKNINEWRDEYNEKNSYVHVEVYRDDIHSAVEYNVDKLRWKKDSDYSVILKQEIIYCPVCGDKHRKYPNEKIFNKIKNERN